MLPERIKKSRAYNIVTVCLTILQRRATKKNEIKMNKKKPHKENLPATVIRHPFKQFFVAKEPKKPIQLNALQQQVFYIFF